MDPPNGFLKISFDVLPEYEKARRVYPFQNSEVFERQIIKARKLTKGEDVKDVYDICLDLTDVDYDYHPGDTIGILPHNALEEVNNILKILNCTDIADKKCYVYVENEKKRRYYSHIPKVSTIRNIFVEHVDIRSPPKKGFLQMLLPYCHEVADVTFLDLCLLTKSKEYVKLISDEGRTLLKLLRTISSCKPPVEVILENLTALQPRAYSIASSPLVKDELHITFSVISITENLEGVCSSYLEKACLNSDVVKFYFRKPSIRIYSDSSPVIMVGPGTGVAPFMGFLQHLYLKKERSNTWLFYGCRFKDRDYLYRTELEKYLNEGYLNKLSVAFSREQADKVYVTRLIRCESCLIYKKFVKENGTIYICGDAKNMFKDIRDSVIGCLEEHGMSKIEADEFIKLRIKENRYLEEKWV